MTYSEFNQAQETPGEKEKILASPDNVKMERAGSQRWLVVQAPAEKIWPVIREFWNELGFAVRVENPDTGVMETEWVDPADITKDENQNYLALHITSYQKESKGKKHRPPSPIFEFRFSISARPEKTLGIFKLRFARDPPGGWLMSGPEIKNRDSRIPTPRQWPSTTT